MNSSSANVDPWTRIDEICERFDAAWRGAIDGGQSPPSPADYCQALVGPATEPLLRELIAVDIDYLLSLPAPLDLVQLQERWPNSLPAEELDRLLVERRARRPLASSIDSASDAGDLTLSVADVDLIYLDLRVLIAPVERMPALARRAARTEPGEVAHA